MKKASKIGCGVLIVLLVLVVITVVAVQVILKNHLGPIIQAQLPPVKEKLQLQTLEVGNASVNLLGGSVRVDGIKVGNPKGFQEPVLFSLDRFIVEVGAGKLIKAAISKQLDLEIPRVELKDAELKIIRNPDSTINLQVLADTLSTGQEQKPSEVPKETVVEKPVAKQSGPLPKIHLKIADINTSLRYADYAISKTEPLKIAIKTSLKLRNIATYDIGTRGSISITGALEGDANLCKTDLKGQISALIDPLKPTMEIAGDIGNVDLRLIRPYLDMAGFGCDSLSLKIDLACKDGVIDGKSVITLLMTKVLLTKGGMPPGVNYLNELTVPVPLEGTITAPKVNMEKAVVKAILDNLKNNSGAVAAGLLGEAISGGKDKSKKGDKGGAAGLIPKLPF
ncbi:MAG: AsmA family protein [bacterium]